MRGRGEALMDEICRAMCVSVEDVRSGDRRREYSDVRKVLAYALTEVGLSDGDAGRLMNRSRSLVTQMRRVVAEWRREPRYCPFHPGDMSELNDIILKYK